MNRSWPSIRLDYDTWRGCTPNQRGALIHQRISMEYFEPLDSLWWMWSKDYGQSNPRDSKWNNFEGKGLRGDIDHRIDRVQGETPTTRSMIHPRGGSKRVWWRAIPMWIFGRLICRDRRNSESRYGALISYQIIQEDDMDGPMFPTRIVPCVMMNWYLYARIRGKMIDTIQVAMVPRVQRRLYHVSRKLWVLEK